MVKKTSHAAVPLRRKVENISSLLIRSYKMWWEKEIRIPCNVWRIEEGCEWEVGRGNLSGQATNWTQVSFTKENRRELLNTPKRIEENYSTHHRESKRIIEHTKENRKELLNTPKRIEEDYWTGCLCKSYFNPNEIKLILLCLKAKCS